MSSGLYLPVWASTSSDGPCIFGTAGNLKIRLGTRPQLLFSGDDDSCRYCPPMKGSWEGHPAIRAYAASPRPSHRGGRGLPGQSRAIPRGDAVYITCLPNKPIVASCLDLNEHPTGAHPPASGCPTAKWVNVFRLPVYMGGNARMGYFVAPKAFMLYSCCPSKHITVIYAKSRMPFIPQGRAKWHRFPHMCFTIASIRSHT